MTVHSLTAAPGAFDSYTTGKHGPVTTAAVLLGRCFLLHFCAVVSSSCCVVLLLSCCFYLWSVLPFTSRCRLCDCVMSDV